MAKKTAQKTKSPAQVSTPAELIRKVPRSAKSGMFVTKSYAKTHPSTTEVETIKVKIPKPEKKA